MSTWAEAIVAGKEASAAAAHIKVGYDPELEKQRLAWEMKRYDEEREYQRARDDEEREYTRKKKEEEIEITKKEIALKEANIKKVETDHELRRLCENAQFKLKIDELKLRQEEVARQVARDSIEKARDESVVTKMRILEMPMRGTAFKMSHDPVELIPCFDHNENSFHDLKVDENIKVKLIRPFLNNRVRSLQSRIYDKYDLIESICCMSFNCRLKFIWNVFILSIVQPMKHICCSHHV